MRTRLRIILPVVNLMLAIVLLYWGRSNNYADLRGVLLCQWINTPATIAHKLLMSLWNNIVIVNLSSSTLTRFEQQLGMFATLTYLVVIVATWYIVGLELSKTEANKRALVPLSRKGRVVVDGLIILVGIVLMLVEFENWRHDYLSLWILLRATLHLAWALLFIFAYGRDFVRGLHQNSHKC